MVLSAAALIWLTVTFLFMLIFLWFISEKKTNLSDLEQRQLGLCFELICLHIVVWCLVILQLRRPGPLLSPLVMYSVTMYMGSSDTTAYRGTSLSCRSLFMICASWRNASGDMVPVFSVLMATLVVPFHVPAAEGETTVGSLNTEAQWGTDISGRSPETRRRRQTEEAAAGSEAIPKVRTKIEHDEPGLPGR